MDFPLNLLRLNRNYVSILQVTSRSRRLFETVCSLSFRYGRSVVPPLTIHVEGHD